MLTRVTNEEINVEYGGPEIELSFEEQECLARGWGR